MTAHEQDSIRAQAKKSDRRTVCERHGGSGTTLYMRWGGMIARCSNSLDAEYMNYGGRGIRVCERWRNSFEAFRADMGEPPSAKHSLDRKNNDGHYEPGNCRWATQKEQACNRRTTTLLTHEGRTLCVQDWARVIGLTHQALAYRLRSGWSVEKAIATPLGKRNKR